MSVDTFRDICDLDWLPGTALPSDGVIHCKTEYVASLFDVMRGNGGRYVVVTHRSDLPFTTELAREIPDNVHVFARNCTATHPRLDVCPIGLAERSWPHGNWSAVVEAMREPRGADGLLYAGFALGTNLPERSEAARVCCELKGTVEVFPDTRNWPRCYVDYLRRIRRHRFTLSPAGNGVDCHRTFEALYLQATPICRRCRCTEMLARVFPIMLVDEWRDLTRERLLAWREPQWDRAALKIWWWRRRFEEAL